MSRQSQTLMMLSVIAAGAIAANRFVTPVGAQAGAAANTLGVSEYAAGDAGDVIPVAALGTAVVEAGGIIAAGGAIETDASGRAVAKAAGATVARALQAAGAAGEFIEVVLIPN